MLSRVEKFEAALAQTDCDAVLVTNLKKCLLSDWLQRDRSDSFYQQESSDFPDGCALYTDCQGSSPRF